MKLIHRYCLICIAKSYKGDMHNNHQRFYGILIHSRRYMCRELFNFPCHLHVFRDIRANHRCCTYNIFLLIWTWVQTTDKYRLRDNLVNIYLNSYETPKRHLELKYWRKTQYLYLLYKCYCELFHLAQGISFESWKMTAGTLWAFNKTYKLFVLHNWVLQHYKKYPV